MALKMKNRIYNAFVEMGFSEKDAEKLAKNYLLDDLDFFEGFETRGIPYSCGIECCGIEYEEVKVENRWIRIVPQILGRAERLKNGYHWKKIPTEGGGHLWRGQTANNEQILTLYIVNDDGFDGYCESGRVLNFEKSCFFLTGTSMPGLYLPKQLRARDIETAKDEAIRTIKDHLQKMMEELS